MGSRSRGQWPINSPRQDKRHLKARRDGQGPVTIGDSFKHQNFRLQCQTAASTTHFGHLPQSYLLTYGCLLYCLRKSIGYQPQIFDHIFMIWLACNLIGSVFLHKLLPENNNWQITNYPTHWCIYWLIEWCTKQRDLIHPSKN